MTHSCRVSWLILQHQPEEVLSVSSTSFWVCFPGFSAKGHIHPSTRAPDFCIWTFAGVSHSSMPHWPCVVWLLVSWLLPFVSEMDLEESVLPCALDREMSNSSFHNTTANFTTVLWRAHSLWLALAPAAVSVPTRILFKGGPSSAILKFKHSVRGLSLPFSLCHFVNPLCHLISACVAFASKLRAPALCWLA